jgi:phenylacetate-CoA ligase
MEWPPKYDPGYVPSGDSQHWDPHMETMDPAERDKIILQKMERQVRYAYDSSAFYRELYEDVGVDPTGIRSFEEFRQLPILSKDTIKVEQENHPPFGRFLCIPEDGIFRIHGTSGTTGRPTAFGIGYDDWQRIGEAHARILWGVGLRPGDCVIITSVFSLYIGSWGALVGAERLGARCFPFGAGASGQTERALEWISMVKPAALYATPSYVLYMAEVARGMGYDPRRDFNFRLMFFSGEPGASVPSTRKEIEDTYGCYVVDQGSMAEMTPWMTNSGCRHLEQGMHLWTDIVYTELVDPDTREPVPLGGEGVPVYTHLERTSQPLIRYWSGDIARWDMVECRCGRTYPTLTEGIYGRVDDMITVRGQNVFPSRIEDVVRGIDEFGGEFRLLLEREPGQLDRLTVQTEVKGAVYSSLGERPEIMETLSRRIADDLRRALGVGVSVELKPEGTFERTEFKARRIIDNRGIWRVRG